MDQNSDYEQREASRSTAAPPRRGRAKWLSDARMLFFFAVFFIGMAYVLVFMPTNYVIFSPGSADEIKPMVHIKQGYETEKGTLMLTTVRLTYANFLSYLSALVTPHTEIFKKSQIFSQGEDQSEYSSRQSIIMSDSQSNAMEAAYKRAGIPFNILHQGVIVLRTVHGFPVDKLLQAGDKIIKLNEVAVHKSEDVFAFMKKVHVGDKVKVSVERKIKEITVTVPLVDLNQAADENAGTSPKEEPRPGLGIVPADLYSVKADNPQKQVNIDVGDIGGPSAGLMFSLEIYNRLVPEDITKGYRIAGTGEIDPQGNVGVIGGIQHKIVAADRKHADIFFAPDDLYFKDKSYKPILNYSDAVAEAKKIGTKMKVVKVKTMDDALKYLQQLPPKK